MPSVPRHCWPPPGGHSRLTGTSCSPPNLRVADAPCFVSDPSERGAGPTSCGSATRGTVTRPSPAWPGPRRLWLPVWMPRQGRVPTPLSKHARSLFFPHRGRATERRSPSTSHAGPLRWLQASACLSMPSREQGGPGRGSAPRTPPKPPVPGSPLWGKAHASGDRQGRRLWLNPAGLGEALGASPAAVGPDWPLSSGSSSFWPPPARPSLLSGHSSSSGLVTRHDCPLARA